MKDQEECQAIAPFCMRGSPPPAMPASPGFCKKPKGHNDDHETSKTYGSVRWPQILKFCLHCKNPIKLEHGIWWHIDQKRDIHSCISGGTVATPGK